MLDQVADELQRLQDQTRRLTSELAEARTAPTPVLDEATVAGLLGEEAARVLATAKEAAAQIRAKAEDGVDRLLRDARDDVTRLREDVALEVSRLRQDAAAEASAEIEAAKAEGRQMVAEARAVRERMLGDLARRRDAARSNLERLRADRDRLVASFEDAGRAVDAVLGELREVVPEPTPVETVDEAIAAVAQAEPASPLLELVENLPAGEAEAFAPDEAELVAEAEAELAAEAQLEVAAELEIEAELEDDAADAAIVPVAFHLGEEPVVAEPVLAEPDVAEPSLSYAGELDEEPERRTAVDDLFARIRAAGPADVAADVERADGPEPGEPSTVAADPEPDEIYLAERAAVLDPLQSSVARHIKRALTDEQNEVLDALRRLAAPDDIDALVGAAAEHATRYRRALNADLRTATAAGARAAGSASDVPSGALVDAALAEVETELVTPLRERLTKALEDAGGDSVEASATLRAAYREWRTQRADEVAGHLVLLAHGRGEFDAIPEGTPIHWVVDPEGPLCPDADDNALGGVIAAGEQFPTGHCHAPAHPGCRCGILQTQG